MKSVLRYASMCPISTVANSLLLARVCCDYVDITRCFGYEDLPEKLNGVGVHSLDNITTLDYTIHSWFDELQLWPDAEVRGLQFSVLTLNVCRTARRTPILSVWQKKHTVSCARKIQSCSKVHTQAFRCQTLSTSRFTPMLVHGQIFKRARGYSSPV